MGGVGLGKAHILHYSRVAAPPDFAKSANGKNNVAS